MSTPHTPRAETVEAESVMVRLLERARSEVETPFERRIFVNRTLRMAYEAAPSGVRRLARQTTARDFRKQHRIQLSAAPTLLPVNENGEFHSGAIADQEETYRISTFGRIISLSFGTDAPSFFPGFKI